MSISKALTIAGSDSGGGAGIQADLKTFQELNVYGMSAITAVTAQNTLGVHGVFPLTADAVVQQIEAIGSDIGADAIKTGMLFNSEIIEAVSEQIKRFNWSKVIVDPVMIAKGGASLLQDEAVEALKNHLLPLALVVTPNIPEAEVLTGLNILNLDDRQTAAKILHSFGVKNVVIKGGHAENEEQLVDLLFDGTEFSYFTSERIHTKNTHGTGCTFAAAITAEIAKGKSIYHSAETAVAFIREAIKEDLKLGQGHGPTNHWAYQKKKRGPLHVE
ncbi:MULTISPECIES: bifunctional hydroxymethylpyrimidine kinase/phosphomethylpyrimidine kinase [Metabacillus]|uniref:Bifunctional hydroxymethylpyrimidine kinase/phosphomethylpyrimidine kinase n=1 Tax=Metabacillus hrfriensis TaxID=3048891 RepID=A0ACD4R5Q6_9BACI|nr:MULTISPECIES: bifunctional hydroxymethylpyrimidine kinase/phosphomethylpyrimidine kinase [Metabacillus]UAL50305.1 bifunctional hydroxymethylpyrimidine kinase/phosphomethylpyrimidine kinase [Metabacillus dongyingensis]UOK56416.1 bifunctional hydroxymethylpyrimidine kinase/phosphomethylpyrimidine kinase [Bacillus sp. OVS6]USK26555.1 bifunctional hydroxymethylpyrimidine kinase/phosphomethylpyrimidine kinase [Bacillus sp. CMF21]WHZ55779.1 bifunctional hydroxymethylpyrimidine kinase/phosphomethyl